MKETTQLFSVLVFLIKNKGTLCNIFVIISVKLANWSIRITNTNIKMLLKRPMHVADNHEDNRDKCN